MLTIAFYSYKGGSGRSLLLANAARFLALTGKRVVALDLDLEAPGLHHKLHIGKPGERIADVVPERGVVDYLLAASDSDSPPTLSSYAAAVALPDDSGQLSLIPAGAAPSGSYWRALTELGQRGLLGSPDGEALTSFLELKARIEEELEPDVLLIDARTGITELAGIATTLLADKVVCLVLDNPESLAGTRAVLRSLTHAVRLGGQDPVEVLPVLSRVALDHTGLHRRVLEFLNEPSANDDDTLAFDRLFVLPNDPILSDGERLLLGGNLREATSSLAASYVQLVGALAPGDASRHSAAFRRQQATQKMLEWLTESEHNRHRPVVPSSFNPMQIDENVPLGRSEPRHADVVAFADRDRTKPVLAAEYAEDLTDSQAWVWWQHNTDLRCVLLFGLDKNGRLDRRAFTRARGHGRFEERDSDWGVTWPASYRALRDPGDQSVAARLEAVRAGADDFIGLLVQDWQHASSITRHGGMPYRPDMAREIVQGLASVTDVDTAARVLSRSAPDPFERRHEGMREDGAKLERFTERRLHAPLFWRLSVAAKMRYAEWSRHSGASDTGLDLLAGELLGLRLDQDQDLRDDLARLLDGARAGGDELNEIGYAMAAQFRDTELSFGVSTDAPPELVRRVLLRDLNRAGEIDVEERSHLGWARAETLATGLLDDPQELSSLLHDHNGRRAVVTTNLLGIYDPASRHVTLFRRLIDWAATALDIPPRELENIVFIHECVHAVCHLGRDLDGRGWPEFALPSSQDLDFRPSKLHEELAQYFTFRLIERLEDEALMRAFEHLSDHQVPEYQSWRQLRDIPVEYMRAQLMRARTGSA